MLGFTVLFHELQLEFRSVLLLHEGKLGLGNGGLDTATAKMSLTGGKIRNHQLLWRVRNVVLGTEFKNVNVCTAHGFSWSSSLKEKPVLFVI